MNATAARPQPGPGKVAAIKIPCNGERSGFFIPVEIDEDDSIFSPEGGYTAPVSQRLNLTLRIRKCSSSDNKGFSRPDLDNQVATYLMIETASGFAKPIWQSYVGTVIVAREDKKSLTEEHLEAFWSYNSGLLDRYGDGDPASVERSITPDNFGKFFKYNYNRPRATDFLQEWNQA